jgi:hypothetical protein
LDPAPGASHPIVWLAEADDFCAPTFLERLVPAFADPEVVVRHCTADIARARRLPGFEPRIARGQRLAELVAWSRQTEAVDQFQCADDELRARLGEREEGTP